MIPSSEAKPRVTTRHLELPADTPAPIFPNSLKTGPLDTLLPWVIELRIVGTATTIQAQVREAMIVGRGDLNSGFRPEVDLMPFDAYNKGVSRRHAIITVKSNRLFLRDLNSTNGSRVNGLPCEVGGEHRLRHGDELHLGQLRLQMTFAVVPAGNIDQTAEIPMLPVQLVQGMGQRVLIVENDPDVGSVFKRSLEESGFVPTLVNDVTKGLGTLFQTMPDAIILDMMLPDMNGLDLLHYVRRQKTARRIPILVIGGGSQGGYQVNQALEAGADVILNKPVAVSTLMETLSGVFTVAS
ncbi:MAG: response regulator [Chloroflexota bacterium]|nr:response regulator [Chloroflexota bacterium]